MPADSPSLAVVRFNAPRRGAAWRAEAPSDVRWLAEYREDAADITKTLAFGQFMAVEQFVSTKSQEERVD
jgi:hypothetical protein